MTNAEKLFVYDEDGLFNIAEGVDETRLSGGIQTGIGSTGTAESASGFFCSNKDSCS